MEIIFLLIALSIGLALFFLFSFMWATRTGQFEDTQGPAVRILFEDEITDSENATHKKQTSCN